MRVLYRIGFILIIVVVILFSAAAFSRSVSFAGVEKVRTNMENSGKGGVPTTSMPAGTHKKYQVGYRVLEISTTDYENKKVSVDVAVWYPSSENEKSFQYTYGKNQVRTEIALNGKPASGKFPLVIYSHGATGCGLSMAFLTEKLASEGFIVASPDYPDEYYLCRTKGDLPKQKIFYKLKMLKWIKDLNDHMLGVKSYRPQLAYRPNLVKAVINEILDENKDADSPFYGLVNGNEIGMVGHSFGAWTSILVGGADLTYKDPRVKAIVSYSSPVYEGVFELSEMANIRIPAMFMYGEKEARRRGENDRQLYDWVNAPKFLLQIKGAGHLTFSGGVREEFSSISEYRLKDPIRAAIVDYTVAFFEYYLKNDNEARKQLDIQSKALVLYRKDFSGANSTP
jgi:predicted dienelactone hydrolase